MSESDPPSPKAKRSRESINEAMFYCKPSSPSTTCGNIFTARGCVLFSNPTVGRQARLHPAPALHPTICIWKNSRWNIPSLEHQQVPCVLRLQALPLKKADTGYGHILAARHPACDNDRGSVVIPRSVLMRQEVKQASRSLLHRLEKWVS